jgi:NlpC/P60 family protein
MTGSHFRVLRSRFVFRFGFGSGFGFGFGFGSGFGVRVRGSLALFAVAMLVTGCAAKGTVATPRPFPGATVPPRGGQPEGVPPELTAERPAVIAMALSYLGTPYRNGGSDPSGFDCSGFVQWVFAQHGTALPREVRDQYRTGDRVDSGDVRPGDLVFFETVSSGASHVGIALGGGEFIHAPSSRGVVRIERYTSSYWADRWVGARRITMTEPPAS